MSHVASFSRFPRRSPVASRSNSRSPSHPQRPAAQKAGIFGTEGWVAYCRGNHLFVKLHQHMPDREYPDQGSSAELFTNASMLEVETPGPVERPEQGQSADHWEDWFLFDGVPAPAGDTDVDRSILPRIRQARDIADAMK